MIGIFAFLNQTYDLQNFAWVPLFAVNLTILSRGIGTLPVIFTLMNETFPTEIRTQAIGISETIAMGFGSLNISLYPVMKNTFGFHMTCYFYAAMGTLNAIWGAITIPDNRGKSLVKVEEFYEKK